MDGRQCLQKYHILLFLSCKVQYYDEVQVHQNRMSSLPPSLCLSNIFQAHLTRHRVSCHSQVTNVRPCSMVSIRSIFICFCLIVLLMLYFKEKVIRRPILFHMKPESQRHDKCIGLVERTVAIFL